MTLDFDPFKVPAQLVRWLAEQPREVQDQHIAIWARRASAARFVLFANQQLRLAMEHVGDERIAKKIGELLELALVERNVIVVKGG